MVGVTQKHRRERQEKCLSTEGMRMCFSLSFPDALSLLPSFRPSNFPSSPFSSSSLSFLLRFPSFLLLLSLCFSFSASLVSFFGRKKRLLNWLHSCISSLLPHLLRSQTLASRDAIQSRTYTLSIEFEAEGKTWEHLVRKTRHEENRERGAELEEMYESAWRSQSTWKVYGSTYLPLEGKRQGMREKTEIKQERNQATEQEADEEDENSKRETRSKRMSREMFYWVRVGVRNATALAWHQMMWNQRETERKGINSSYGLLSSFLFFSCLMWTTDSLRDWSPHWFSFILFHFLTFSSSPTTTCTFFFFLYLTDGSGGWAIKSCHQKL